MKKILIVVDMQNDFISGSLGTKEAQAIVPYVCTRLEKALSDNDTVIFTRDTHDATYLLTAEGKALPVEHCIKGTWGWEIDPLIQPYADSATIIDKPTFGSFELIDKLRSLVEENTDIELLGLCTDICVVSNAILVKAAFPENRIMINAPCCAGVTVESHDAALITMSACQIEILR